MIELHGVLKQGPRPMVRFDAPDRRDFQAILQSTQAPAPLPATAPQPLPATPDITQSADSPRPTGLASSINAAAVSASLLHVGYANAAPVPTTNGQASSLPPATASYLTSSPVSSPAPASAYRPDSYTVRSGDTLTGIVQKQLQREGLTASPSQLLQAARSLAANHGIPDPDFIVPGMQLQVSGIQQALGIAAPASSLAATASTSRTALRGADSSPHPILEQTLQRAVALGYVPVTEKPAVEARILELSRQFGFRVDDFALVGLMESDGFNPKASNGNCHGIIQFCDGTHRGAHSVGYLGRAEDITQRSVLEQLDLVETYFRDVGLDKRPKPDLADLYLSVLMPSARAERRANQPLDIPNPQASVLYQNRNRHSSITRSSLVQGLHQHATNVFSSARLAQAQTTAVQLAAFPNIPGDNPRSPANP